MLSFACFCYAHRISMRNDSTGERAGGGGEAEYLPSLLIFVDAVSIKSCFVSSSSGLSPALLFKAAAAAVAS